MYRNVNWSLFVKLKAIEFALNELRYLRHTIVSLYFYFASSSATLIPYNLDKLVSTFFIYQFLYLFISKIDSSKIFHEYINTSYIRYLLFVFFFIDKYFERNAMNLRKKMSTKLVVCDSKAIWFGKSDLLEAWKREIWLFLSLSHDRRLPSLMRFNRSPKLVD